jgi:hypothetical protein
MLLAFIVHKELLSKDKNGEGNEEAQHCFFRIVSFLRRKGKQVENTKNQSVTSLL